MRIYTSSGSNKWYNLHAQESLAKSNLNILLDEFSISFRVKHIKYIWFSSRFQFDIQVKIYVLYHVKP
jgi:hypothetical protein